MVKRDIKKILVTTALTALLAACGSKDRPNVTTDNSQNTMGNTMHNQHGNQHGQNGITAGSLEDFRQNVGDRVFFNTADYTLSYEAKQTLSSQALWLQKYANNSTITIEGHADERGTRDYNMALGARRANSVRNYLASQGIPITKFNTISYGKERPAVEGSNASSWAQNRRVVIIPR